MCDKQNRAILKCVMNLTTPRSTPDDYDQNNAEGSKDENRTGSLQLKLNDIVRKISVRTIFLR